MEWHETGRRKPGDNGRSLRRFRELSGLTMGDLSDITGMTVVHVSALERGQVVVADECYCNLFDIIEKEYLKRNPPKVIDTGERLSQVDGNRHKPECAFFKHAWVDYCDCGADPSLPKPSPAAIPIEAPPAEVCTQSYYLSGEVCCCPKCI